MKQVVIFGGTGGLGKQLAENLKADFNVIAVSSKDVDVRDFVQVKEFFDKNQADIVLNFSGLNYDSFMHKYTEADKEIISQQLDINIKGTIHILSACLVGMRQRGFGRIILASSILAESPVVSTGIYAGCKGFIDSIAKTVALENAAKNITCNSLQLGYFNGGLTYKIPVDFREKIIQTIPMKRLGEVAELGNVIRMLINTSYITGTSMKINGGMNF